MDLRRVGRQPAFSVAASRSMSDCIVARSSFGSTILRDRERRLGQREVLAVVGRRDQRREIFERRHDCRLPSSSDRETAVGFSAAAQIAQPQAASRTTRRNRAPRRRRRSPPSARDAQRRLRAQRDPVEARLRPTRGTTPRTTSANARRSAKSRPARRAAGRRRAARRPMNSSSAFRQAPRPIDEREAGVREHRHEHEVHQLRADQHDDADLDRRADVLPRVEARARGS